MVDWELTRRAGPGWWGRPSALGLVADWWLEKELPIRQAPEWEGRKEGRKDPCDVTSHWCALSACKGGMISWMQIPEGGTIVRNGLAGG